MNRTRIYTYGGRPARRNLTVARLISLKGTTRLCQTCPATVMDGHYPDAETSVSMSPDEHEKLLEALDARPNFHS